MQNDSAHKNDTVARNRAPVLRAIMLVRSPCDKSYQQSHRAKLKNFLLQFFLLLGKVMYNRAISSKKAA